MPLLPTVPLILGDAIFARLVGDTAERNVGVVANDVVVVQPTG
jgi:hypothetical protein